MQKRTCSLARRVQSYLNPRIYRMFIADAKNKIKSESTLADDIITKYYESLSMSHQESLLNDYNRIAKE